MESSTRSFLGSKLFGRALFVFDECHHLSRPRYSKYIDAGLHFTRVLGLSATPFSDESHSVSELDNPETRDQLDKWSLGITEKNDQIRDLIGDVVHSFDLTDAIKLGYLSPYNYEIYTTHLPGRSKKTLRAIDRK